MASPLRSPRWTATLHLTSHGEATDLGLRLRLTDSDRRINLHVTFYGPFGSKYKRTLITGANSNQQLKAIRVGCPSGSKQAERALTLSLGSFWKLPAFPWIFVQGMRELEKV